MSFFKSKHFYCISNRIQLLSQVILNSSTYWSQVKPFIQTSVQFYIQPLLFTFLTCSQQLLQEIINYSSEYIQYIRVNQDTHPCKNNFCVESEHLQ